MNLIKRVKTQEEKDKLIGEAKKLWDSIPGEISHLVAASEDDYLQGISNSIEVGRVPSIEPRPATAEETAELNGHLLMMRLYGDRADSDTTGIPAIDDLMAKKERNDLEKLLGPGKRAESALEITVREMVRKAIGNQSVPRRESDREGIVPRMARLAAQEDASSLLSKFLQGYVDGDEAAMRKVAASLATA